MVDWEINFTPERRAISAPEDSENEFVGIQIEGNTTFCFTPERDLGEAEQVQIVESVLEGCDDFEYGKNVSEPYYRVALTGDDSWSVYHVAVEGGEYVALFVRTSTTEESVEHFYRLLERETAFEWSVEKNETDLTGSGPNRKNS